MRERTKGDRIWWPCLCQTRASGAYALRINTMQACIWGNSPPREAKSHLQRKQVLKSPAPRSRHSVPKLKDSGEYPGSLPSAHITFPSQLGSKLGKPQHIALRSEDSITFREWRQILAS